MRTSLLAKSAFLALLGGERAQNITGREEELFPNGVIDIWPYVRAVPAQDLDAHTVAEGQLVDVVYRTATGSFDLVHVPTTRQNVYLVVVIDVANDRIHGHHLLDLNTEYDIGARSDA